MSAPEFGRRSRRGTASSYSTRHHDRVFRKRAKNPRMTWCLVLVACGTVIMRHEDRDAVLSFKVRNRVTGTEIVERPWE